MIRYLAAHRHRAQRIVRVPIGAVPLVGRVFRESRGEACVIEVRGRTGQPAGKDLLRHCPVLPPCRPPKASIQPSARRRYGTIQGFPRMLASEPPQPARRERLCSTRVRLNPTTASRLQHQRVRVASTQRLITACSNALDEEGAPPSSQAMQGSGWRADRHGCLLFRPAQVVVHGSPPRARLQSRAWGRQSSKGDFGSLVHLTQYTQGLALTKLGVGAGQRPAPKVITRQPRCVPLPSTPPSTHE